MVKWTGRIYREKRIYTNPKITDDIFLHFSEIKDVILHYAPNIKGKVLDVGAGNSPYKDFFKNASKYVRLDSNDYNGIDIKTDASKIPLKNNYADSVVCFHLLEHVLKPEKIINEIYRVLKKKGVCLLTTVMASPLHGIPYDYYRFTEFALRDLFKKFKKVEIKANGGALLSLLQFIVWGISEKFPKIISKPLIIPINFFGKKLDKIFYDPVFTLNYTVFAIK